MSLRGCIGDDRDEINYENIEWLGHYGSVNDSLETGSSKLQVALVGLLEVLESEFQRTGTLQEERETRNWEAQEVLINVEGN